MRNLGFERLRAAVDRGEATPDVGGPGLHPTAGACCVGVRKPLVAFNVLVAGQDAEGAKSIASEIRESAGGLPGVKALGMHLESAGLAQVSMNLTDPDTTPVDKAFDEVSRQAKRRGIRVLGSEIVGLVPREALGADPDRLRIRGFTSSMVLEEQLRALRVDCSAHAAPLRDKRRERR